MILRWPTVVTGSPERLRRAWRARDGAARARHLLRSRCRLRARRVICARACAITPRAGRANSRSPPRAMPGRICWLDRVERPDRRLRPARSRVPRPRHARSDGVMERVNGIGGVFFKSNDCRRFECVVRRARSGVGAPPQSYGAEVWRQDAGPTVFAPFGPSTADSPYLGPLGWGINFRVDDLDAMVEQLRACGLEVDVDTGALPQRSLRSAPGSGRKRDPALGARIGRR